jgi:hypothetical protein
MSRINTVLCKDAKSYLSRPRYCRTSLIMPPVNGRASSMDQQAYFFECMLRRPSFQEAHFEFLRKFPVFFHFRRDLLQSYGVLERRTSELWEVFLGQNAAVLERADESGELYKYVIRSPGKSNELQDLERRIRNHDDDLCELAHERLGERPQGPVLFRLSEYETTGIPTLRGRPSSDYLSAAGCNAEDFERAEMQFQEKWGVAPHFVRPQEKPMVLFREELMDAAKGVQLLIPISDFTTKEELVRRWPEVVSLQTILYSKKRRPRRTPFATLLEIYDFRQDLSAAVVAKKLALSKSAIEKHYRRVYRDVHDQSPNNRSMRQGNGLRGRRKTRVGFGHVAGTKGTSESEQDTLRRVFLELGLPLEKLHDPSKLSLKQRKLLRDALTAGSQERQRRGF